METVAVGTSATDMRATTAFHRLCLMGFLAYSSYAICRTPLLPLPIYDIGDALGPIVAGLLVASVGYSRMFQIMAFVAVIVDGAFWLVSRRAHGPLNQDEAVTS